MKKYILSILILCSLMYTCYGQRNGDKLRTHKDLINTMPPVDSTMYSGTFNGKNLFFENNGFCIKKITVNGRIAINSVDVGTFEIDFTKLKITSGEDVVIKIIYSKDCTTFKCLNEQVLHSSK